MQLLRWFAVDTSGAPPPRGLSVKALDKQHTATLSNYVSIDSTVNSGTRGDVKVLYYCDWLITTAVHFHTASQLSEGGAINLAIPFVPTNFYERFHVENGIFHARFL